jgi:enoyl-CoA hydratase/carnithine racemase
MPASFTGETLSWRHESAWLEVELHRAPLNEIGTTTLSELEIVARYLRDGAGGARALVWHSTRPGFCAGADLRQLYDGLVARRPTPRTALGLRRRLQRPLIRRAIRAFLDRIHRTFDTFDTAPIPTIAATHGVVFGGGFELALTADLIVADKTSRFCFPELRLGLVPGFGGIPRLERDLGNAVVRDLLLTGRSLNARRAHEVGLVHQVAPRGEALGAARRVAEQASRFDGPTTAAAKAFAKPLPRARLEQEKQLFCRMVTEPAVFDALERFVTSDDVRPYLPASQAS